jgi:homoserine kinase
VRRYNAAVRALALEAVVSEGCSKVTVRVPSSTSNLGAGFDGLGMALGLYVEVEVERTNRELEIQCAGREADQLDRGPDNLLYQRLASVFERQGQVVPGLRIHIRNEIPLLRGLGASGAATIAGLLAGSALSGADLCPDEVLRLAVAAEHHPDNVTPSYLGGFVAMALDQEAVRYVKMPAPDDLAVALLVPRFGTKTTQARGLLPAQVPLKDAVFNLTRAGLTVAAICSGHYELLATGTQDRLHQPYRTVLFPAMDRIFAAARAGGAYGAFLSGAGSTILAFTAPERAEQAAEAMRLAAEAAGVPADTMIAPTDNAGAQVSIAA